MILLTLESTCDETAAAVIAASDDPSEPVEVLSSVVASQDDLHAAFRGVVPEIAARAHMERILPIVDEALRRAGRTANQLDAVAVASTPGLAGSLLVGVSAAKGLALALGVPLVGIDHLHAHLYACQMAAGRAVFPAVGLVVSGGHTNLFDCRSATEFVPLGGTIDDAAGEAFDKVGSLLGLPFPGGPALSRLAAGGNAAAYRFPRSFLDDPSRLDFSFSGLKTAVRYALYGHGDHPPTPETLAESVKADVAASFQQAVVDCLVAKTVLAAERAGRSRVLVGGGVAANPVLRQALTEATASRNLELIIAPMALCTDNAVMGAVAVEKLRQGAVEGLGLEVRPGRMRMTG